MGITDILNKGGALMNRCVQKIVGVITTVLCIGFILCISGPVCILIGVIFMASPDSRSHTISQYNAAVTTWKNTYKADMDSIIVRLLPSPPNLTYLLAKTHAEDDINDQAKDGEEILTYTTTYFTGTVQLGHSNVVFDTFSTVNVKVEYSTDSGATWRDAGTIHDVPQFVRHTIPVTSAKTDPVEAEDEKRSKCTAQNGYYSNGECEVYLKANKLCLKFSGTTSSTLQVDDSYGGYGCKPNDDTSYNTNSAIGRWSPVSFVKLTPGPSGPPNGAHSFSMTAQARHTRDPWVQLQHITGGSLSFGVSQRDKVAVGVIFIVVGIALFLPWIVIPVVAIILCLVLVKVISGILKKPKSSGNVTAAPTQMQTVSVHAQPSAEQQWNAPTAPPPHQPPQGQWAAPPQPGQWNQPPQGQWAAPPQPGQYRPPSQPGQFMPPQPQQQGW